MKAALDGPRTTPEPAWAEGQHARFDQVLAFMLPHAGRLEDYGAHWAGSGPDAPRVGEKIACELAWLLLLGRRVPLGADAGAACAYLAETLAPFVRSPRHLVMSLQNPQFAGSFAIAHFALTEAGLSDPVWDRVVREGLGPERFDIKERYPHRILERLWVLDLYGRKPPVDPAAVAALSILAGDADPLTMTESDAYAYTHAVFYLADFGRSALPASLDVARIRAVVDAAIAWQAVQRDFDLLGEFLICAALLGGPPSASARLGLKVWAATWDALGFLPGPSFDQQTYAARTGDAARAYAFAELYHTNLVGGLLALVGLHGAAQAGPAPAPSAAPLSAEGLAAALTLATRVRPTSTAHGQGPALAAAARSAPGADHALLDGLSIVAARSRDFATIAAVQRLRREAGRPPTWIDERIARFLGRYAAVEPARLQPVLGDAGIEALADAVAAAAANRGQAPPRRPAPKGA